jgi:acyl-CoA hydrolase
MQIRELPTITASHLAKSIDLNHHGTLFAGRMSEWVVEVGFITARAVLDCQPEEMVCACLDRLNFTRSVPKGSTVVLVGEAGHVGKSSVTIFITADLLGEKGERARVTEGYATFVHIGASGSVPHGVHVDPPAEGEALDRWQHVLAQRKQFRA